LQVVVETGISSHLVGSLTRDDVDVVVTARPGRQLPDGFVSKPLFKSRMIVICRTGHPLRSRGKASMEDLAQYGRIGFVDDYEFDRNAKRALGRHAQHLKPIVQTASMSIMFGLLSATDCFAIVADMLLPKARHEGLAELSMDHRLWQIEIDLMCKLGFSDSGPVSVIRAALLSGRSL
jgi:DNA-binding transcriptional LysR family regulator